MQRIIRLLGDQFVCPDAHQHIGRLDADDHLVIAELLDDANFVQSALDKTFRCHTSVLLNDFFLKRSRINADTNRNLTFSGHIDDSLNALRSADVTRIDTDRIGTVLHSRQCHTIVKVNIRYDRNVYILFDFCKCLRCLQSRHRRADDLTSRLLEPKDLRDRRIGILRVCIGHRLHGYRISSAYEPVSYADFSGSFPVCTQNKPPACTLFRYVTKRKVISPAVFVSLSAAISHSGSASRFGYHVSASNS